MSIDEQKNSKTNELPSSNDTTQDNAVGQSQEFFVTPPKKTFSIFFILTIIGALFVGGMIVAYIHNIFGLRDFALRGIEKSVKTQSSQQKITFSPEGQQVDVPEYQSKRIINAQAEAQLNQKADTYSIVSESVPQTTSKDIFSINQAIEPVVSDNQNLDNPTNSDNTVQLITSKPNQIIGDENITDNTKQFETIVSQQTTQATAKTADNIVVDSQIAQYNEQQEALKIQYAQQLSKIKTLHQRFSEYLFDLQSKLISGEPYLAELVELKSEFTRLDVPTLTEYASGGFPTEVLIMNEGIDALKRAAVTSYHKGQDKKEWENLLSRFAVITSEAKTGFNSDLGNIEKSFKDGDFIQARKNIRQLSAHQQLEFKNVMSLLDDRQAIFIELKKINHSLSDEVFSSVVSVHR